MKKGRNDLPAAMFFLAPSLLGLSVFFVIPFVWMIFYSFVDSPINGSFAGVDNYIGLFKNSAYQLAVKNTVAFIGTGVPFVIVLALFIAILLNRTAYFREKITAAFVVPLVVPVSCVVLFFNIMFDNHGIFNNLLINLDISEPDWENGSLRVVIISAMYLWKNIGYNIVLFLAGLNNIPDMYYEAASIDGANSFRKFSGITMVYIMPTMFFVFVISVINAFKVFKEIYVLDGNYPNQSIYMLQHFMNNMFARLDYHKLVASAIIFAGVIYIIIYAFFKVQKRVDKAIS